MYSILLCIDVRLGKQDLATVFFWEAVERNLCGGRDGAREGDTWDVEWAERGLPLGQKNGPDQNQG